MGLLERFTDLVGGAEERRQQALEDEHRHNEAAARLYHQGNHQAKQGRTSAAFQLWRLSGVEEARAEQAEERSRR